MKKITNIFVAMLALLSFASCGEKGPELSSTHQSMVGSWHLVEWAGSSAEAEAAQIAENGLEEDFLSYLDVWISFNPNGTFDIYQKGMPYIYYTKFSGSCVVNGDVLDGVYDDEKPLGSQYNVSLSDDGKVLTLTKVDMTSDVAVYERVESIPTEVTDAVQTFTTRGEEVYNIKRFL